ncbi:sensor histidine kinase, partial [Pseudoalteromonas sp. S1610]
NVFLTLSYKVIDMSDERAWRFNTYTDLDITTRRDIKQRPAYLDHQPLLITPPRYNRPRLEQVIFAKDQSVAACSPRT